MEPSSGEGARVVGCDERLAREPPTRAAVAPGNRPDRILRVVSLGEQFNLGAVYVEKLGECDTWEQWDV